MANHGFVKTKKKMTIEFINKMLDELNFSHFKNNLEIESPETTASATWRINYISSTCPHPVLESEKHKYVYATRSFWLNTSRSFEMRHGGGGNFAWWIDSVIVNEVALRFNGTISDEGVSEKWKGKENYCLNFLEYAKRMIDHIQNEDHKNLILKLGMQETPPEFKFDFGSSQDYQMPDGTILTI